MSKGMRTGFLLAGTVALSVIGFVVQAQDEVDPHFQSHALRYAGMIERAYGRLYGHIRSNESVPVSWSGAAVPPASTGWEAVWTEAGLRARYCDNVLVVYMGFSEVKGVGGEHRAIQQARRSFLPERERGVKLPLLSWLEAGDVVDAHGNVRPLDPCMTASYSEPLPSGRAALAGAVVDPATVVRERESYEYRVEPCPAGQHGQVRERRTVRRTIDGNDNEVETPAYEAWESTPASWCRADYTYHELFTRPCRWYQGEPFNREMEGTETWRVPVGVSKDPENPVGGIRKTPGASEFVSSTCWDTPPGDVPVPSTSHEYFTETHILSCPPNMSGQIDVVRQRITTTTTYPWGEDPLMTVSYTNWSETSNSCTRQSGDGGGGDGGEGGEGGYSTGDGEGLGSPGAPGVGESDSTGCGGCPDDPGTPGDDCNGVGSAAGTDDGSW